MRHLVRFLRQGLVVIFTRTIRITVKPAAASRRTEKTVMSKSMKRTAAGAVRHHLRYGAGMEAGFLGAVVVLLLAAGFGMAYGALNIAIALRTALPAP